MVRKASATIESAMEWSAHHLMLPLVFAMALLLLTTTVYSAVAHSLAMKMANSGGMLVALGVWEPPSPDERGRFMNPKMFMTIVTVFAAATKFLTSRCWHEMAVNGRDNCSWLLTYFITIGTLVLLIMCMMVRYQAWHF